MIFLKEGVVVVVVVDGGDAVAEGCGGVHQMFAVLVAVTEPVTGKCRWSHVFNRERNR